MKKAPTIRISRTQFLRLPIFSNDTILNNKNIGTFYRINNNDEDYLLSLGDHRNVCQLSSLNKP
jgi:hypothetical protein